MGQQKDVKQASPEAKSVFVLESERLILENLGHRALALRAEQEDNLRYKTIKQFAKLLYDLSQIPKSEKVSGIPLEFQKLFDLLSSKGQNAIKFELLLSCVGEISKSGELVLRKTHCALMEILFQELIKQEKFTNEHIEALYNTWQEKQGIFGEIFDFISIYHDPQTKTTGIQILQEDPKLLIAFVGVLLPPSLLGPKDKKSGPFGSFSNMGNLFGFSNYSPDTSQGRMIGALAKWLRDKYPKSPFFNGAVQKLISQGITKITEAEELANRYSKQLEDNKTASREMPVILRTLWDKGSNNIRELFKNKTILKNLLEINIERTFTEDSEQLRFLANIILAFEQTTSAPLSHQTIINFFRLFQRYHYKGGEIIFSHFVTKFPLWMFLDLDSELDQPALNKIKTSLQDILDSISFLAETCKQFNLELKNGHVEKLVDADDRKRHISLITTFRMLRLRNFIEQTGRNESIPKPFSDIFTDNQITEKLLTLKNTLKPEEKEKKEERNKDGLTKSDQIFEELVNDIFKTLDHNELFDPAYVHNLLDFLLNPQFIGLSLEQLKAEIELEINFISLSSKKHLTEDEDEDKKKSAPQGISLDEKEMRALFDKCAKLLSREKAISYFVSMMNTKERVVERAREFLNAVEKKLKDDGKITKEELDKILNLINGVIKSDSDIGEEREEVEEEDEAKAIWLSLQVMKIDSPGPASSPTFPEADIEAAIQLSLQAETTTPSKPPAPINPSAIAARDEDKRGERSWWPRNLDSASQSLNALRDAVSKFLSREQAQEIINTVLAPSLKGDPITIQSALDHLARLIDTSTVEALATSDFTKLFKIALNPEIFYLIESIHLHLLDEIKPTSDKENIKKINDLKKGEVLSALAFCYEVGKDVVQNRVKAEKLYTLAAKQGHAPTQFRLALHCERNQNYKGAAEFYLLAANQGHTAAQFHLAVCYEEGAGVEKDMAQAARWYRAAAEQNSSEAQFNLAICYQNGTGVEKDMNEAIKWYEAAAKQGDASAQFNLAICYQGGNGIEKDMKQAIKWYKAAAEQGNAKAQFNLAICHEHGDDIEKNLKKAVELYKMAISVAELKPKALNALSRIASYYRNGLGVTRDLQEANEIETFVKRFSASPYNPGWSFSGGSSSASSSASFSNPPPTGPSAEYSSASSGMSK